jgi:hypothetical protein
MIKLLYSSAFPDTVDVRMSIVEDPAALTKSASTIFGCDYAEMLPDQDHVGMHVVALGDFEHYGSNRNGDGFPKKANVAYHHTFVKHGNLYRHHKNKDPEKRLGQIVKSAHCGDMGRVELFVHAHKEKARDELHKLATDGEIPFSMACKVPFDRCSVCGTLRKSASDSNQCEHVLTKLGEVLDDGKIICTHNDTPRFFDISFVSRPADRIAWNLKVAEGECVDSVKLAEAADLWIPDGIAIESPLALKKLELLNKMAAAERELQRLAATLLHTSDERYMWELRKAASAKLSNEVVERLRNFEPQDVFYALAKKAVVLDVDTFFKYAMGMDYGDAAPFVPGVRALVPGIFTRIEKDGRCQQACNDTTFDVDTRTTRYGTSPLSGYEKTAHDAGFFPLAVDGRIISATLDGINPEIRLDKLERISSNVDNTTVALAEKYAAYKLAAVTAIGELNENTDNNALLMLSATQNFVNT